MSRLRIIVGDCRDTLRQLEPESVQCVVTSPPYWGLRDYDVDGQLGLEATPGEYVRTMVEVFREVRRVLRCNGTLWMNIGDTYISNGGAGVQGIHAEYGLKRPRRLRNISGNTSLRTGLPAKSMAGIPWRVAFALQEDGRLLRQEIIWHKPNPLPESVRDRCTKAHEQIFLLTNGPRYLFNADAITERATHGNPRISRRAADAIAARRASGMNTVESNDLGLGLTPKHNAPRWQDKASNPRFRKAMVLPVERRNKRSVWTVGVGSCKESHFATFPPALVLPCILAGSNPGDIVLDPFGGAGTTAMVAIEHGRKAILCEINPEYAEIARARVGRVHPRLPLSPLPGPQAAPETTPV